MESLSAIASSNQLHHHLFCKYFVKKVTVPNIQIHYREIGTENCYWWVLLTPRALRQVWIRTCFTMYLFHHVKLRSVLPQFVAARGSHFVRQLRTVNDKFRSWHHQVKQRRDCQLLSDSASYTFTYNECLKLNMGSLSTRVTILQESVPRMHAYCGFMTQKHLHFRSIQHLCALKCARFCFTRPIYICQNYLIGLYSDGLFTLFGRYSLEPSASI